MTHTSFLVYTIFYDSDGTHDGDHDDDDTCIFSLVGTMMRFYFEKKKFVSTKITQS